MEIINKDAHIGTAELDGRILAGCQLSGGQFSHSAKYKDRTIPHYSPFE
jgi:hypothetical protein